MALFGRRDHAGARVRTPVLLQLEATECGAACLGIVLAYLGKWVPLEELREACAVGRDGANAADISKAARRYGLEPKAWRRDLHHLPQMKMPLILFWEFRHFVVLEGIGRGRYYVNDPAMGRRVISEDEFDRCFTGIAMEMEPGEAFEPGGSRPDIFKQFGPWLASVRPALAYAIICGLLLVIPGLAVPLLLSVFVDHVIGDAQSGWAGMVVGLVAAAGIASYILAWLQMRVLRKVSLTLSIQQSDRLLDRLLRLPMQFFTRRFAGDLTSRVRMIDEIALIGSVQLIGITIELVMGLGFLILMLILEPVLGVAVGLLGLLSLVVMRYVTRLRTDHNHILLHEQGLMTGIGMSGLHIMDTLKATASENSFYSRFSGYQARELNARQKFAELGHLAVSLPPTVMILGTALVIGLGGWRVISGDMTLGVLTAFYVLAANFLNPIGRFALFSDMLQTMSANLRRLDDVMDAEPDRELDQKEEAGPGQIVTLNRRVQLVGRVELRNVTFGFQSNRPPLIENFSLTIEPGQRVAIVGPSGSGKSTLSLLVAGIYQPWSGEVRFDGHLRSEIPREILAGSVGMVDQNIVMFAGSVHDNLTLWNPTTPDHAIVAAARDAAIHDEIVSRPLGYASAVEENGRNFSGGQRQRLEIARALVSSPSVLIFDEATSALDTVSELQIDEAVRRRGCTCMIVAHRLSTIRDSDLIIVLEGGKEVQRGTHEELMATGTGLYHELVQSA